MSSKKVKKTNKVNPVSYIRDEIEKSVLTLNNKEQYDKLTVFSSTYECDICEKVISDVEIDYCACCDTLTISSFFGYDVSSENELLVRQVMDLLNRKMVFGRFIIDDETEDNEYPLALFGKIYDFSKHKYLLSFFLHEILDNAQEYENLFSEINESDIDAVSIIKNYQNKYSE